MAIGVLYEETFLYARSGIILLDLWICIYYYEPTEKLIVVYGFDKCNF